MTIRTFPHVIIHINRTPSKNNNFNISPVGDDENAVFVAVVLLWDVTKGRGY